MSVETKALSPRAKHALVELHKEYKQKLENAKFAKIVGCLPRGHYGKLSDEYEARVKAIVREGMVDTANDRNVRVQCPSCKRIEIIPGDVPRWTCVCSTVERHAFQTYYEV